MLQMIFVLAALFRRSSLLALWAGLFAGFALAFSTPAQAGFTYDVTITEGTGPNALTYTTSGVPTMGPRNGINVDTLSSLSNVEVVISGQALQSPNLGKLVETQISVYGLSSTAPIGPITVTLTVHGYTQPAGGQLATLSNSLSTSDQSPLSYNASMTGTVLSSAGAFEGSNSAGSISPGPASASQTSFFSLSDSLGDPYQIRQVTTLSNVVWPQDLSQVQDPELLSVQDTTQVTAPAPGGLVLVLTAFPALLGMRWAHRRNLCRA
jgi:hypothetical protein